MGKSPILEETLKQKKALSEKLNKLEKKFDVFVVMRYVPPRANEVIEHFKKHKPEKIILLPLYPQFSNTTTGSSFKEFCMLLKQEIKNIKIVKRCCYPTEENFIDAHVEILKKQLILLDSQKTIIIFSAHSLPVKNILSGDPYQWQVEQTVNYIIKKLNNTVVTFKITYQSKVGPMKWLEPSTEKELVSLKGKFHTIIVVPISFVSENSETVFELDIEYKKLATDLQIDYIRLPTISDNDKFINSLTKMVLEMTDDLENKEFFNERICPANFKKCPNNKGLIENDR